MQSNVHWIGEVVSPDSDAGAPGNGTAPERVLRDMESIFGLSASTTEMEKARGPDAIVQIVGDGAESWRVWLIGIALVSLTSVLVAGGLVWMGLSAQSPASASVPLATVATTQPRTAPLVRQPQITPAAPRLPSHPAVAISLKPIEATHPKSEVAPQSVQAAQASNEAASNEADCSQPGDQVSPNCVKAGVTAADQQLRIAYALAESAGVDPKLLTTYRERWYQVRKEIASDPAYVTVAYRQLARELDAARATT